MGRRSELAGELARLRRLMREPEWSDLDERGGDGGGGSYEEHDGDTYDEHDTDNGPDGGPTVTTGTTPHGKTMTPHDEGM